MKEKLKPQDVNGLELAFGGDIKKLLPAMGEIPKEFHDWSNDWNKFISTWFYKGLAKLDATTREGVDRGQALRHIKACMGSWEPSHEHKMAGCAYLMNQFFEEEFSYEASY